MTAKKNGAGSAVSHTGGPQLSGTNLERAGDHNQRLTLPAIANITKRLLNDELIIEAGRRRGGRGQPATKLVINPDGCFSVGINIDRDHITMVVLGFDGQVRARSAREIRFAMPGAVQGFFKASI